MVDDAERTFVVHLPKAYDPKQHYPAVLLLPGQQQDAEDMARLTRFNEVADRYGVIAVYPNPRGRWNVGVSPEPEHGAESSPSRGGGMGGPGMGGPGMGRHGGRYPGGSPGGQGGQPTRRQPTPQADDLAFFNEMLDKLASSYSVDVRRIYATGLSDGGFMAIRAGCHMADRIAAIAPVGAEMPKGVTCVPARRLPVMMINGTSDPIVPYKGSSGKPGEYATHSAGDSAKTWAELNNCDTKPQRTVMPPRSKGGDKVAVDSFTCKSGGDVVLYSVKGAGNTWPGGEQYMSEKEIGKTSNDLNANETIWKFFATQSLPAPAARQN
jgi:polyhydroxybutyrate depolymerase